MKNKKMFYIIGGVAAVAIVAVAAILSQGKLFQGCVGPACTVAVPSVSGGLIDLVSVTTDTSGKKDFMYLNFTTKNIVPKKAYLYLKKDNAYKIVSGHSLVGNGSLPLGCETTDCFIDYTGKNPNLLFRMTTAQWKNNYYPMFTGIGGPNGQTDYKIKVCNDSETLCTEATGTLRGTIQSS